ncbi:MAG TPA: endonuclease/exonuclease/phosphatase family protein [Labilithrix sp.]|nr:endonuclease/exonuclease/phosphatase family protein [Labilithrix sp.]
MGNHFSRRLLVAALVAAAFLPACASRSASSGKEPAAGKSAQKSSPPLDLAFMTFNIRFDNPADGENVWSLRRSMVVDLIRQQHTDFVGLQEALRSQLDDIGPPAPYGQLGVGRSDGRDGGEFSAILYRKDRFDVNETGTFWLSPTPEVPGSTGWGNNVTRICTWGEFTDRITGRRFYVFNTHLDHESQQARARGVELIARRIAMRSRPEPVVLMGDLNAGEDNPAVLYLTGKAPRASEPGSSVEASPAMADTFRILHPSATSSGTFNGWTGDTSGPKIDYILALPANGVEVLEASILHDSRNGKYPSDHYPVTARLRLR